MAVYVCYEVDGFSNKALYSVGSAPVGSLLLYWEYALDHRLTRTVRESVSLSTSLNSRIMYTRNQYAPLSA